jgi:hypothetical protein
MTGGDVTIGLALTLGVSGLLTWVTSTLSGVTGK